MGEEGQQLTKRERRLLRKQERLQERDKELRMGWVKKVIVGTVVVAIIGWGGYKIISGGKIEQVGELVEDLGREHVRDIAGISYNSNPPTSGKHFPVWAKKGVYDRVISDGHLIHSLEHGYIIVSYDCTKLQTTGYWPLASKVYAHEEGDDIPEGEPHSATDSASSPLMQMKFGGTGAMSWFTSENPPEAEIELPESFQSKECQDLVGSLKNFYEKNKSKRVIVVPRVGMGTSVAVTAWNRILKFNVWDEGIAQKFVEAWNNKGPEKTVE
ncbi:MAG: DUF3105 domain-containing protein [Candidatus Chisholmbacteria bacterium]|nr:DUF3105 domain-containing protein [Candidatus Chisholmbacteria bacterium]